MKPHQNHPHQLEQVLAALNSSYRIEHIYLNAYSEDGVPYQLVILLCNKYIKYLGELVPQITNTIRAFNEYKVMCYIAFQAKDKIRQGNLFLYASCQPHKLVYQKENSDFVLLPGNMEPKQCLALAVELRKREQEKILDFKAGYYHFKAQGRLAIASFLLHQVFELTYRYLELLLTAKERISHSIRVHHIILKDQCALYSGVFDEDEESDIDLFKTLEAIYRATRYEDGFYISPETLQQLEQKMECLCENEQRIVKQVVNAFEGGGSW